MICGLVVHLSADSEQADNALRAIAEAELLETGERCATRLPLVAETEDSGQMHELTDWLTALPGVEHVDVAFADVAVPQNPQTTVDKDRTS